MITKERLTEIISNLVVWGQDHNEDFYDCLMSAADMTDEELAELGFVYDYDGEEIKGLVKLQEKLEKQKKKEVITSPKQILAICKENNIDTQAAFVAGACECAFQRIKEDHHSEKPFHKELIDQAFWSMEHPDKEYQAEYKPLSYDDFCSTCEELWLDWDEMNPGLTTIADYVADYYNEHHELPEHVWEII